MTDIANKVSQQPLLDLTTGFMRFKTFAAAVELDVFSRLSDGREVTAQEFATTIGLQQRPADILLPALVALGLLDKDGEKYRNSAVAEEFLVKGRPYFFGGFVQFYDRGLYPGWEQLVNSLRTNRSMFVDPEKQDTVFAPNDFMMNFFWEAMHSLAGYTGKALGEVYDFGAHRALLDVGGGSGGIPIELCQTVPGLTAGVYELPHVCPVIEKKIGEAGLDGVISALPGDFNTDEVLPGGYDAMLLSQVMHCGGEESNRALLDKCFTALEPGGAVLICELLLNPDRTGPANAAVMGLNMLVSHPGGQNYSEAEYRDWLSGAGFVDIDVVRFDAAGADGAVIGRKPA
ncbi:methyltransferase [Saccharopolyspora dendranthemae]|uniref:Methyltransferase family protein n=1 Tax=Saccharopolyspora dendranthemae TaxID=1181886 RepID=A0A561U3F3_9PSEU|nr:methyltransferase [Saccharopolyspora dendranthemae]TWF93877.1 methyltransferase family protein [Saccharopolyspora dendranthemae]